MIALPFSRPAAPPAIRLLRARHAEACAALHAGAFAGGWSAAEFKRMVEAPDHFADGAFGAADGRLVGFAVSRLVGDEAELLSIAVDPASRGAGVGATLLGAHMGRLAAARGRTLFLEVEEGNAAALALYARHGFERIGRRPAYYRKPDGAATAAIAMRRTLA
ncbi:MAG: ribosomal protein S18-alanine N-acetyltransferase [Hyphomicrobiales bacterium]|nr:ribosomal protein S18-alanine N-acetyltransferase [Hyphomicrobiales bacterium]